MFFHEPEERKTGGSPFLPHVLRTGGRSGGGHEKPSRPMRCQTERGRYAILCASRMRLVMRSSVHNCVAYPCFSGPSRMAFASDVSCFGVSFAVRPCDCAARVPSSQRRFQSLAVGIATPNFRATKYAVFLISNNRPAA